MKAEWMRKCSWAVSRSGKGGSAAHPQQREQREMISSGHGNQLLSQGGGAGLLEEDAQGGTQVSLSSQQTKQQSLSRSWNERLSTQR